MKHAPTYFTVVAHVTLRGGEISQFQESIIFYCLHFMVISSFVAVAAAAIVVNDDR